MKFPHCATITPWSVPGCLHVVSWNQAQPTIPIQRWCRTKTLSWHYFGIQVFRCVHRWIWTSQFACFAKLQRVRCCSQRFYHNFQHIWESWVKRLIADYPQREEKRNFDHKWSIGHLPMSKLGKEVFCICKISKIWFSLKVLSLHLFKLGRLAQAIQLSFLNQCVLG